VRNELGFATATPEVPSLPAGQYKLEVSHQGVTGTYGLEVLMQPAAQSFSVSSPVSISDGVPSAGAGNLETTASEDDYLFSSSQGTVQLAFSACTGTIAYLTWDLRDATTDARIDHGQGCGTVTEPNVPAGNYKLIVTALGMSGTYKLGLTAA
jgi:hypothetical protein